LPIIHLKIALVRQYDRTNDFRNGKRDVFSPKGWENGCPARAKDWQGDVKRKVRRRTAFTSDNRSIKTWTNPPRDGTNTFRVGAAESSIPELTKNASRLIKKES
jgi:hypothetical protein